MGPSATEGRTPRIAFVTLGCAKNEVDTDAMARRLAAAGYEVGAEPEGADALVVNTCSFIQAATEESLDAIFEAAELPRVAAGEAALIVAGCMPARYGDDLAKELEEATAFVPCSREDDIVAVVASCVGPAAAGAVGEQPSPPALAAGEGAPFAYVKVSDGCDRFCSYCAIPLIRGRYRSFPYEDVRAEVARAVADGAAEVVLIGQDTGRWGADLPEPTSLAALVGRLAEEFPSTWLRVMYVQPEGVTDELLDAMAAHPNVCPYLDVPLQHVDAQLLRAMNRTGSGEEFLALAERILERLPGATLRTTLIAGFPGETEEQFEALCAFVEEAPFDYVGVFPYSREEGTRAAELPGQLDEEEKAERARALREVADAVGAARVSQRVGRRMDVLVEGVEEDGQVFGRAQCQAPEVDGATFLDRGVPGQVVAALIGDTLMYEMEGEVL